MEFFTEHGYLGLFIISFLAATLLPLSSELVLVALLLTGMHPVVLIAVASTGNILGSITNYTLGYWASTGLVPKWLRMSETEFAHAKKRFTRYGMFSLLLAWVPVIGDPLTVIAGILRVRFHWFLLLVSTGKLGRYCVITYITLYVN
ncbi:YqaA family protein [Teredinibacter purpureus]|jgi:Predicted membrane protein|uniref:YqaA family protein n=1 Tax=Teredinibacter purpureus TaxID=2731756 RepID=UPI0005F79A4F|nr:YqaA family protein [Teredinibacter purpureus]